MAGITSSELAWMRDQMADMLPDTVVLKEVTRTADGEGGWSESWTPVVGGTVSGRLDEATRSIRDWQALVGEQVQLKSPYLLTLAYDAPIAPGQRVEIGGTTYAVIALWDEASWRVFKRAVVDVLR